MAVSSTKLTGAPAPDIAAPAVTPQWGVTRASVLAKGERRLEAETYLSDGFGRRKAIEGRPDGWSRLGDLAHVWQPGRLKGVVVAPAHGVPFLAAGQVFEARPSPRKWLSLAQTDSAAERFVESGTLLVSCSGVVGRVTVAHSPHIDRLITHDLLRVIPQDNADRGWLYAYMRTGYFRAMATGAHYGHVIKHIEPAHLSALPVVSVDQSTTREFGEKVTDIFAKRDLAHALVAEAEDAYSQCLGGDLGDVSLDDSFVVRARSFAGGRRRFDAFHFNPVVQRIRARQQASADRVDTLAELCERIWWPNRFKRSFGDNATPYVSAEDLFNLNPPINKRVYAGLIENRGDYFLKADWLVMARSGQIYGLNGSVRLVGARLTKFLVSEDLIRIAPRRGAIRPGYLLCALSHPSLGRPLIISQAYGTSIPHLEPADVATVPVTRLESSIEDAIADRMEKAVALRAEADEIEDEITVKAERMIDEFMHGSK
jgi:type I restriction enzyme S subunit